MKLKKIVAFATACMILFGGGMTNLLSVQEKFYSVGCVSFLEASAASLADYADQVVALVNRERANYGLAPVQCSVTLNDVAQIRAGELEELFSHTRPDGTLCYTVLDDIMDIDRIYFAENIARYASTPEEVVDGWMNSEGHRANILDGNLEYLGVGISKASKGYYWTQVFVGGTDLHDTYLPEIKDLDPIEITPTVPDNQGGTVRFNFNNLDLQKDDKLYLNISGDAGDTIQVYFYYEDENGNMSSSIIGVFGGIVLDSNGEKTVDFTAPNAINNLSGKIVYEKSEPSYHYTIDSSQSNQPNSTSKIQLAIDKKTLTIDELEALNYQVPIFVRLEENAGFKSVEFGTQVDSRCDYSVINDWDTAEELTGEPLNIVMEYSENDENFTWATFSTSKVNSRAKNLLILMVEVPRTVSGGEQFTISYRDTARNEGKPVP
ncbi:MAG: hypothetical protein K2H93_08805, partial [Oscillospiraceae bacterium]|nr:hypothetical protein [Oscillospiraceae bacterium]